MSDFPRVNSAESFGIYPGDQEYESFDEVFPETFEATDSYEETDKEMGLQTSEKDLFQSHDGQAVYPSERQYYRPDPTSTKPETADEEVSTTGNYFRTKSLKPALSGVEFNPIQESPIEEN